MTTATPAGTGRAQQLAAQAADAAEARAYATHPDVVALRLERVRAIVDRAMWAGIVLGLLFTMTNVQGFAARESGHSPAAAEITARLGWWSDWLLDPMVAAILIAILIAEQVTGRYRLELGGWVRFAKWFTLAATYLMNTWEAWSRVEPGLIVLHSVPPIAVFAAAEAAPRVRAGLTEAIERAHREAAIARRAEVLPAAASAPLASVESPVAVVTRPAPTPAASTVVPAPTPAPPKPAEVKPPASPLQIVRPQLHKPTQGRRTRSTVLTDPPAVVLELLAEGHGWPTLQEKSREQGIELNEYQARELIKKFRTNGHQAVNQ
jgi:hypothetical protein